VKGITIQEDQFAITLPALLAPATECIFKCKFKGFIDISSTAGRNSAKKGIVGKFLQPQLI
jgi:hypothetical protein